MRILILVSFIIAISSCSRHHKCKTDINFKNLELCSPRHYRGFCTPYEIETSSFPIHKCFFYEILNQTDDYQDTSIFVKIHSKKQALEFVKKLNEISFKADTLYHNYELPKDSSEIPNYNYFDQPILFSNSDSILKKGHLFFIKRQRRPKHWGDTRDEQVY